MPVVDLDRRSHVCGGSANVAAHLVSFGGRAVLAGVVCRDLQAKQLSRLIDELGVGSAGLIRGGGRPTTSKLRVIAHGQQIVRIDSEDNSPIDSRREQRLFSFAEQRWDDISACVLSDYDKGVITPRVAGHFIRVAGERRVPVVVDPKGFDFSKYQGATVVTPNIRDAEGVLRVKLSS